MSEKYYKPSNNFSFVGFILLILSTAIVGSLISFVYLKINEICPSVYLCVFLAIGYGLVLGFIATKLCAVFKMRNPSIAIIAMIVGCLIFTYVKWSIYDYNDWQTTIDYLKNNGKWESYIYNYGDISKITLWDIIKDPKLLWEDIKYINSEGRWSLGRSATTNVHGAFLWIVWAIEFAILFFIPVVMARSKANHPYIENEKEWAKEYRNGIFQFKNFDVKALKSDFENDPSTLFSQNHLPLVPVAENYVTAVLYHSSDFSECYLSLKQMIYDAKNKKYTGSEKLKFLSVSKEFVDELFDFCHQLKPFASLNNYVPRDNSPYEANIIGTPFLEQPKSFEELTSTIEK